MDRGGAEEWRAVDAERFYILTKSALVELQTPDVLRATVAGYQPDDARGWTRLGALSTLSHGYWLVFTLPIWTLAGVFTSKADNRAALAKYPEQGLDSIRPFARFPQGLPAGLAPATLKPRPSKPTSDR